METAVAKHKGITQQQCHNIAHGAQISPGALVNRMPVPEGRTSPARSFDLFPTPASSRESVLSESLDGDTSWSAAVSRCSSVQSGMFTPTVVKVRRHALEPGSSLIQMPSPLTSSCESLSSVTSAPSHHRPPLTRLSLLTAILRKGRLPVLSSAQQRPYSPCWPVNPVTMSSCKACFAACSVASVPVKVSSGSEASHFVHGPPQPHDRGHLDSHRSVPTPVSAQFIKTLIVSSCPQTMQSSCANVQSNNARKWETVASHLKTLSQDCFKAGNENTPPQVPLSLLSSQTPKLACMSPGSVSRNEYSEYTVPKRFIASCPKMDSTPHKTSNSQVGHRCYTEDQYITPGKLNPMSLKPLNEPKTSLLQQSASQLDASLAGLDSLSTKPKCVKFWQPSPSHPSTARASEYVSPARVDAPAKRMLHSEQRSPVAANVLAPVFKVHSLSPSRCTPIHFHGWPSPVRSLASTPDRLTLTPSPTPTMRGLTPSPCLSPRSTPSPSPWTGLSDAYEGKRRKPHKIKSSYKSLAAIPTNTLLLDQQVVDEQVDREHPSETPGQCVSDTHIEMCSPAQLRQESEELYAVIDEILEESIPKRKRPREPQPSGKSAYTTGPQTLLQSASPSKSLGRETKYATLCSMQPSTSARRMAANKTSLGVIHPVAIPTLTLAKEEKGLHGNTFRHYNKEQCAADNKQVEDMSFVKMVGEANITTGGRLCSKRTAPKGANTMSVPALFITE